MNWPPALERRDGSDLAAKPSVVTRATHQRQRSLDQPVTDHRRSVEHRGPASGGGLKRQHSLNADNRDHIRRDTRISVHDGNHNSSAARLASCSASRLCRVAATPQRISFTSTIITVSYHFVASVEVFAVRNVSNTTQPRAHCSVWRCLLLLANTFEMAQEPGTEWHAIT